MMFRAYIGINPEEINHKTARHTVKGISIVDHKILMLESNRGDYTFPGGGIEAGESHEEALAREVGEETGHICGIIGPNVGRIDLRRQDIFDKGRMYELISHYYTFQVTSSVQGTCLSEVERVFELKPIWIDIEEAIRRNRRYFEVARTVDFWIQQELFVLESIRDGKIKVEEC